MRNVLYGQRPKTLAEAYTTAQTVFYDNQYLNLDQNQVAPNVPPQQNMPRRQYFGAQQQTQNLPAKVNLNVNCNQPQRKTFQPPNKPEPMDVDTSNRFKSTTNWKQPNQSNEMHNGPQKRDCEASYQQPRKFLRINQIQDSDTDPNEGYEGDICGTIPDDLLSNNSHLSNETTTSSAFLDE